MSVATIYKEYKRAYKRVNSRVHTGTMSKPDFLQWSTEAQEKRDACIDGKLPPEEFLDWLNHDRSIKLKLDFLCAQESEVTTWRKKDGASAI